MKNPNHLILSKINSRITISNYYNCYITSKTSKCIITFMGNMRELKMTTPNHFMYKTQWVLHI